MNLDTILSAASLPDELIVKKVLSPRWQEAEEISPSTQMMVERTFARCYWYLKMTLVLFLLALINVSAGRCSELCGVVVAISTLFLQHNKYECGVVSNLVSVHPPKSFKSESRKVSMMNVPCELMLYVPCECRCD